MNTKSAQHLYFEKKKRLFENLYFLSFCYSLRLFLGNYCSGFVLQQINKLTLFRSTYTLK